MKKYYYEGPTFKLWRGSRSPTFFKGGGESRVPVLNFKGVSGPGSQVPLLHHAYLVQMLLKCEFWKKKSSFL